MRGDKEIVYLVDGSSYIHRAYHAIRHLANSKGFPTNATFGLLPEPAGIRRKKERRAARVDRALEALDGWIEATGDLEPVEGAR